MNEAKLAMLQRSALFSSTTNDCLQTLAEAASFAAFDKNEMVFLEGDPVEAMYLVDSGRIRLFKTSIQGKEHVLHFAEQGESFAEAALFGFEGYPASAQATRQSKVLRIPAKLFVTLLDEDKQFRDSVISSMAIWLRRFADIIQSLTFRDVESRLASYLLSQCSAGKNNCADGMSFDLGVEKALLASYLGTIPETLSRALRKMQDNGIIEVDRSRITILNAIALRESVNE